MNKKVAIIFLTLIFLISLVFLGKTNRVFAGCSGGINCGDRLYRDCIPSGCSETCTDPRFCTPCTSCTNTCTGGPIYYGCSGSSAASCLPEYSCSTCQYSGSSCNWVDDPPTSTPPPGATATPTPPPGATATPPPVCVPGSCWCLAAPGDSCDYSRIGNSDCPPEGAEGQACCTEDNPSGCSNPPPTPTPTPMLNVTLTTVPASSAKVGRAVDLVGDVGGTATGNIRYRFDCTNDGTYDHNSGLVTDDPYTWVDGCIYPSVGTYTAMVFVNRGGLTATDTVTIAVKTLTVTLSASPASGTAPLNNVDLTANVGGTATGNIRYRFDCTNDGTYDRDVTNATDPYTWVNGCDYTPAGTYTARVFVNRGGVTASATTTVTATPAGTIKARAVEIVTSDFSCTAIKSGTIGVAGTVHRFTAGSASQPIPQTQSGASYVTFSGIVGGSYTLAPIPPADYVIERACWTKILNVPASGEGLTTNLSVPTDADTLTWDLGYVYGTPWVQTQGGNVRATGTITSHVPSAIAPRVFNVNGSAGYPGVVSYGTSADFDASLASTGTTLVSSTNWLVKESYPTADYYQLLSARFGSGLTPITAGGKPASGTYKAAGDFATTSAWSVASGESIVVFVPGNMAINNNITVASGGFLAFIVNGDITIGSNVGVRCDAVACSAVTPNIEGIYITSPAGTFITTVGNPARERLILRGFFIAGDFSLNRNLKYGTYNNNPTKPAELFIYEPEFLILMPEDMKELPITWEEVVP